METLLLVLLLVLEALVLPAVADAEVDLFFFVFVSSMLEMRMVVVPAFDLKTVLLRFVRGVLRYGTRTSSLRWFHVE